MAVLSSTLSASGVKGAGEEAYWSGVERHPFLHIFTQPWTPPVSQDRLGPREPWEAVTEPHCHGQLGGLKLEWLLYEKKES